MAAELTSRRAFLGATAGTLIGLAAGCGGSGKIKLVSALGDSMSDLAFYPDAYPRWLSQYMSGVRVLALGEGGDTTAAVLGRCQPAGIVNYTVMSRLLHDPLHPASPGQCCSVLAGVNDLLFLDDGPEAVIGNLSRIYAYLRRHGSTPFPITILPWRRSSRFRASREHVRTTVNSWIRAQPLAIDVENLMGDGRTPPSLKHSFDAGDGIHPIGDGPRLLAKVVAHAMLAHHSVH